MAMGHICSNYSKHICDRVHTPLPGAGGQRDNGRGELFSYNQKNVPSLGEARSLLGQSKGQLACRQSAVGVG